MPHRKEEWESLLRLAEESYTRGMGFDDIKDLLFKQTQDESLVYAVVKKVRSDHFAEIRKQGMVKVSIGLVLVLAGFLITCFNFHSNQSFEFAMYGMTTLGIFIVFWGLYKIMG